MRGYIRLLCIICCIIALSLQITGCVKWVHDEGPGYDMLKEDRAECERMAVRAIREKYGEQLCKDYSVDTARDIYDYSNEDRYPQFIKNEIFMRSRRDMQRSFNECMELKKRSFEECMMNKGWRPAK